MHILPSRDTVLRGAARQPREVWRHSSGYCTFDHHYGVAFERPLTRLITMSNQVIVDEARFEELKGKVVVLTGKLSLQARCRTNNLHNMEYRRRQRHWSIHCTLSCPSRSTRSFRRLRQRRRRETRQSTFRRIEYACLCEDRRFEVRGQHQTVQDCT